MKYLFFSLSFLILSSSAWGSFGNMGIGDELVLASPFDRSYDCNLILVAESSENEISLNFTAPESGGPHGGNTEIIEKGENRVIFKADARWITLVWEQRGKVVASAIFAVSNDSSESRAALLFNPNASEEQLSLDCSLEKK